MSFLFRFPAIGLLLSLSACNSTQVHYYTLLEPAVTRTPAAQQNSFDIDVLPVAIPVQLDQSQFVIRRGATGIVVLDDERWTAPLSDEVRGALSAQLTQRLDTRDIAGLPQPVNLPVLRIKLDIRRFDAWPGQAVQLDADWSLGFAIAPDSWQLICHGQFNEAAPGGYPELARAQQRTVADLAAQITEDASRRQSSGFLTEINDCQIDSINNQ